VGTDEGQPLALSGPRGHPVDSGEASKVLHDLIQLE
jgi:hypothetical protein